jgi:hypothetical protein
MKLSGGVLFAALCSTATAASSPGRLFVFNADSAKPAPRQPASLSPNSARLILAQRLDVSPYHSIEETVDDEVANYLNTVGGKQRFFGMGLDHMAAARVLVWVEGVENAQGRLAAPRAAATRQLTNLARHNKRRLRIHSI